MDGFREADAVPELEGVIHPARGYRLRVSASQPKCGVRGQPSATRACRVTRKLGSMKINAALKAASSTARGDELLNRHVP
jgi:hypothetical protein